MGTHRARPAFVGRERELARLCGLLERAGQGEAAGVLVGGDAGVGKTRLVGELVALAGSRGAVAAVGRCVDLGAGGLPYLPFTEALGGLASVSGSGESAGAAVRAVVRERPALARLTGAGSGPGPGSGASGADDALQRLALYDAVGLALRSAATAAGALVVVLEDLHWADASTRDLVRFILTRLSDERLLVVGTYRTDDLDRRHPLRPLLAELVRLPRVERLDLPPFDTPELRSYLTGLLGAAVDERVLRDIAARSEGNAFYAGELLCCSAGDDGAEGGPGRRGVPGALPGGLADVLLATVERLPEPVQHVALVASVAGRRVPDALLRAVLARSGQLSSPAVDAALRDAVAYQVLVPDGVDRFAFRHALLQEAVYSDLLPGERVGLHRSYAEVLATEPDAATAVDLARHAAEAHDDAGALAAWLRAAAEAERRLAPDEALTHYEKALRLWPAVAGDRRPQGVAVAEVTLRAARAASASGEFRRAIALGRAAASEAAAAGDRLLEARARHGLAEFLYENDDDQPAMAEVGKVRGLLDGLGPQPTRVWAATVEARVLVGRGDLWHTRRENLLLSRDVVETALTEARHLDLAAAEALLLVILARSDGLVSGPEAAAARLEEASRRGREAGDPDIELHVRYHLGVNALDVADLGAACRHLADALAVADRAGLGAGLEAIDARLILAQAQVIAGTWDDAVRTVTTDRPRMPARESLFMTIPVLPVYAARDPVRVPALVAELEACDPGYPTYWTMVYSPLADALSWLGRHDEALEAVRSGLAALDRIGRPLAIGGIQAAATGLAALAGAVSVGAALPGEDGARLLEHARRVAATGATRLRELGPEGRAWLAQAEAEATRLAGQADVDAWRAAHDAFGYGDVYQQARAGWRLAEALLTRAGRPGTLSAPAGQADRKHAADLLVAARATADRLAARPLLDAVDAAARRHRLDLGAGALGARLLTPREEQVLALVAEGLTNRQIGARLFISEKTASVHISNLLAKLGVSGRAEAVSVAHRRGLLGP